ncbi:hypothetical protein PAPYR_9430 [Paratrimastix pyriformis]|uniref:TmcB/TmcC TPR repeats domain-containing protein n=1 Tax=Paratrimastix pyriformis TaxID=342808 RepID=A0ABQ8UCG6_9EUKA|nr:hypothetical protein PAPYR_9430 [Paratrimastix pyriformis]
MNAHASDDFLSRVERAIFQVFFIMKIDGTMQRWRWPLFFVQALQLWFTLIVVPDNVVTQSGYVKVPLQILDFSFVSISSTYLYITFGIVSAMIAVALVIAILVGAVLNREDTAVMWPLRFLRFYVLFLLTWGFIPLYGTLLSILDCRYGATIVHDLFPDILCWTFPHAVPSVMALIMLVVFVPYTFGSSLLVFDRQGFDAHARGRFDSLVIFGKLLIVSCSRLLTAYPTIQAVVNLGSMLVISTIGLFAMPFHNIFANCAVRPLPNEPIKRPPQGIPSPTGAVTFVLSLLPLWFLFYFPHMTVYACCFMAALERALLSGFPEWADSWGPFLIALGVCCVVGPLAFWVTYIRYNQSTAISRLALRRLLASYPLKKNDGPGSLRPVPIVEMTALPPPAEDSFTGGYDAAGDDGGNAPPVLATNLLYLQLHDLPAPEAILSHIRMAMGVEWSTRFLRWKDTAKDPRLVSYAEAIYSKGLAKFPESHGLLLDYADFLQKSDENEQETEHGLLLDYADFLQAYQRNTLAAITVTRRIVAIPGASFDTRYMVYAYERDFESQASTSDIGSRSAHVMSMLTYRRNLKLAQFSHKRAKKRVSQIWVYLLRPSSDISQLPIMLSGAVENAQQALETYSSMMKSFPNSIPLLRFVKIPGLPDQSRHSPCFQCLATHAMEAIMKCAAANFGLAHAILNGASPATRHPMGYGSLLQDLYGDTDLGDQLFARADQLEEDKMPGRISPTQRAPGGLRTSKLQGNPRPDGRQWRSVMELLANRHVDNEESEEAGMRTSSRPAQRAFGWFFFLLHLGIIGVLTAMLIVLGNALNETSDVGLVVRANSNASVAVERLSFYARVLLQLAYDNSDPPLRVPVSADSPINGSRVVLGPAALATFNRYVKWAQKETAYLDSMLDTYAAHDQFAAPWMTWPYKVVDPIVTNGVLTQLGPEMYNLFTQSFDFLSKARTLAGATPEDLKSVAGGGVSDFWDHDITSTVPE